MQRRLKMLIVILCCLLFIFVSLYVYNLLAVKKGEGDFPPEGNFINVEGINLHYYSKGKGQPIVFLHGGILSGNDYKDVMNLAANRGYHAISFDRPGYGYSERPEGMEVTPITQATLLHNALKTLGVDRPIILVGHSWSGTMTLSYAVQYPNEVAGVVLLGAAMYKEGYPAENGDALSKIITIPVLGDTILNTLLKTPLGKAMAKSMVEETFAPEMTPAGYIEETYALGFRPGQLKANREDVLAFPKTSEKLSPQYKNIKTPAVIIVGQKDPFGMIDQARRLQQELVNSKLQIIPEIGHMIPQLHPQVVLDGVEELKVQR